MHHIQNVKHIEFDKFRKIRQSIINLSPVVTVLTKTQMNKIKYII